MIESEVYYLYVTDNEGGNDRWFRSYYPNKLLAYAIQNLNEEHWQISNKLQNLYEGEDDIESIVVDLDIQ
jgi:hypothetical protein